MESIMILNKAARKNRSTAALIRAFTEGAESAGNQVTQFYWQEMKIHGCMSCNGCARAPKGAEDPCVQKDDMGRINAAFMKADMVIFASPVYFRTVTGMLKIAADRLYAELKALGYAGFPRKSVLLMTAGSSDYSQATHWYKTFERNLGWKNPGEVLGAEKQKKPIGLVLRSDKGDNVMSEKIVQTAGRDQLGEFAPLFAHLNDDILFGEVWNEQAIDVKIKCIITVVSLMASGMTDSSLAYHLQNAKAHGVTKEEIAAIITHATMYVGWPKGWAVFRLAKDIWNETAPELTDKDRYQNTIFFPVGEPNPYGDYFVGQSYLAPVSTEQVPVFNVTFEPSCRNNWHIHHAKSGGGQMLICVGGRGYYQEWGKEARELHPGDVVNIPANVKHWHGAAPDSWFSHLAIEVQGEDGSTEWCEAVSDEDYPPVRAFLR